MAINNAANYQTTANNVLVGAANNTITSVGPGSAGQILQSAGAGSNPAYSTATYPNTAASTGVILRANGTNWVATTTTYPTTNVINTLLYASSANVMSALATVNNASLTTSSGGVPTWLSAGTTSTPTCVGSGTPGTTTYTTQQGRWCRIGPMVLYQFNVQGTFGGTAAGNANISIPVASVATYTAYGCGYAQVNVTTYTGSYQISPAVSVMTFLQTTGANVSVVASQSFNFQGTVSYFVA